MIPPFADTSFLCSLYRAQEFSIEADRYMAGLRNKLLISGLVILEFKQSVRLQVHLKGNDRTKGFSGNERERILRSFQEDFSKGILVNLPVDWTQVHHLAETLSDKYTKKSGNRMVDILHVATALHLGASEFLTFDVKQKALAEAEGLRVLV